jgi:dihydroorotase
MATFDLILANGTIVSPDGQVEADIAVAGGKIATLGRFAPSQADRTIQCRGLHILPGIIDTHVHFREPGPTHKEDLATGSMAAILGGVTAVFEMPNTSPATISSEALMDKIARAENRMHCDYAFYVGATRENAKMLGELERLPACCGVKVFMGSSTGDLLIEDEEGLADVLAHVTRRAAFHAEDEHRLHERKSQQKAGDVSSHSRWRDPQTALRATGRLLRLARAAGKQVHVLHVSTAEEMSLLAVHKDIASVEVTPHHLVLSSPEAYERLGSRAQMNPPIRDAYHRKALLAAVRDGTVDVLGSDHAPHTPEEKAQAYPLSPSGMPGVQTLVPVMLDHVSRGQLSLERFVDLTSRAPAQLFGIASKGRIAETYDADFSIVDLKARRTIANDWIASKCGWTPYDGLEVQGWPVGAVLRGNMAMWQGEIIGAAHGRPLLFS